MNDQEKPLVDRVWEFTKDISVKVSRKAEKHWKINTLRVEIASIKHRINVKYKELGRYVYESLKSGTLDEDSYKTSVEGFFEELSQLEGDIFEREQRIELLEQEPDRPTDDPPQAPPLPPILEPTPQERHQTETTKDATAASNQEEPDEAGAASAKPAEKQTEGGT